MHAHIVWPRHSFSTSHCYVVGHNINLGTYLKKISSTMCQTLCPQLQTCISGSDMKYSKQHKRTQKECKVKTFSTKHILLHDKWRHNGDIMYKMYTTLFKFLFEKRYLQLGIKFSIRCNNMCILLLAKFGHDSLLCCPISLFHLRYCRHFTIGWYVSVICTAVITLVPVKKQQIISAWSYCNQYSHHFK